MRRLRITIVAAAIACVAGALASPALAKTETPKAFFGEFVASVPTGGPITPSTPAIAKAKEGELGEFYVGGEETGPWSFACSSISGQGKVFEERSTSFKTEIKFHKCEATRRLRGGLEEHKLKMKIQKGFEIEFHSNGSFVVGHEEPGEFKITKGTTLEVKVKGGACKVIIPEQTVPTKAEKNEEKEYEGGSYSGEREATEKLKVYPSGFKELLEVERELSKITVDVPSEPNSPCTYAKEPGGKYNEELKVTEIPAHMEGDLEEIEIKKGEIFFETAAEHKEKEEV